MASLDPVWRPVQSAQFRVKLLKISSTLGVSNDRRLRDALQKDDGLDELDEIEERTQPISPTQSKSPRSQTRPECPAPRTTVLHRLQSPDIDGRPPGASSRAPSHPAPTLLGNTRCARRRTAPQARQSSSTPPSPHLHPQRLRPHPHTPYRTPLPATPRSTNPPHRPLDRVALCARSTLSRCLATPNEDEAEHDGWMSSTGTHGGHIHIPTGGAGAFPTPPCLRSTATHGSAKSSTSPARHVVPTSTYSREREDGGRSSSSTSRSTRHPPRRSMLHRSARCTPIPRTPRIPASPDAARAPPLAPRRHCHAHTTHRDLRHRLDAAHRALLTPHAGSHARCTSQRSFTTSSTAPLCTPHTHPGHFAPRTRRRNTAPPLTYVPLTPPRRCAPRLDPTHVNVVLVSSTPPFEAPDPRRRTYVILDVVALARRLAGLRSHHALVRHVNRSP
ncbi:hypothetical protein B0H12DRAFT_1303321 [Mycena haematopus]|nr:hypothetical protein B0H12DRAFT_1303321 [Mycena haematopus]